MSKPKKTVGKLFLFLSHRSYQKSNLQKPQKLNFISKTNLTNLIDWPIFFPKSYFGENPTTWDQNYLTPQKSKLDLRKASSDKNEFKFSNKNYLCSKFPCISLETGQILTKIEIDLGSLPKSNFDRPEQHCDKYESRTSSKNNLSQEIPSDPTDWKEIMPFSSLTTPPTPSSSLLTHDCDNPRHPSPKTITKKSESSEVYSYLMLF